MGNALRAGANEGLREALTARQNHPSAMLQEHISWALDV
jgi:hypothetical protein